MADHGSEEWLRLGLGSGVKSGKTQSEDQPFDQVPKSPTQSINPPTSSGPPQGTIRDFFKLVSENEAHSGSTSSPITSRHRQHFSGTPESSLRSSGTPPRLLSFLELQSQSSGNPSRVDLNLISSRVPSGGNEKGQFLSSSAVMLQRPPAFSNLATVQNHPPRLLQAVRNEQTETSSVHVSPWMGLGVNHPRGEARRTPPNPAEFMGIATPGPNYLTMQLPPEQGGDPEQSWGDLLQWVGSNVSVSSGFGAVGASSSTVRDDAMMLPFSERGEHMDTLTLERFRGSDQGGIHEPLTELRRLQRNAMFPPRERPHLSLPFDPYIDLGLARYLNTPSRSETKAGPQAAAASSSAGQRRTLYPRAFRPGLWFTLQASHSQLLSEGSSPLQQIPRAYIRVLDDKMTVIAVKRYLVNKLGLASEDEVELTCKGQPLQPSIFLSQVRDGIWQIQNTPNTSMPQLLSDDKTWKVPDVVMVLTYSRRPQTPPPT